MTTHRLSWIDGPVMGKSWDDGVAIDIEVEDGRATVDRETLTAMAESIRTSGIASDEEDAEYADDILATLARPDGRFDVTDFPALEDQLKDLAIDEGLPPFRFGEAPKRTEAQTFADDMEAAGFEVEPYAGRYFWKGPAVRADDLQSAIRATGVQVQWDAMGTGYVVYPVASDQEWHDRAEGARVGGKPV
jgi:hypothetical protein